MLYQESLENLELQYHQCPTGVVTDGGYASLANSAFAQGKNILHIVFNKPVPTNLSRAFRPGMTGAWSIWL